MGKNSKTVQEILMKLGTDVVKDNMHMYSKGIILVLTIIELCPLFLLRNVCKNFNLAHYLKGIQNIHIKLGTHIARDNTHMCSRGHYSNIINN